jgi:hypothetical protein
LRIDRLQGEFRDRPLRGCRVGRIHVLAHGGIGQGVTPVDQLALLDWRELVEPSPDLLQRRGVRIVIGQRMVDTVSADLRFDPPIRTPTRSGPFVRSALFVILLKGLHQHSASERAGLLGDDIENADGLPRPMGGWIGLSLERRTGV